MAGLDLKGESGSCGASGSTASDGQAMYEKGVRHEEGKGVSKDLKRAYECYEAAARCGHAGAQSKVGFFYFFGLGGLAENQSEGLRYFRMGAKQGDSLGQFHVGMFYWDGEGGLARDAVEAVRWYRRAADQGHAKAQFQLGLCYMEGLATRRDAVEGLRWWRRAADQGLAEAQLNLGVYYEGTRSLRHAVDVARWYRLAADQGLAQAQFNLGLCYMHGRGLARDAVEAVRWYRLAADQGLAMAQFNLGRSYKDGDGGLPRDAVETVRWYRLAADQGDPMAQFNLGVCYMHSEEGLARDAVEAVRWWRLAADQGLARAQAILGKSYETGDGHPACDAVEAVRWYRRAADQGDATAQCDLGSCYLFGKGVGRDAAEARRLLLLAAGQNNLKDARAKQLAIIMLDQLCLKELCHASKSAVVVTVSAILKKKTLFENMASQKKIEKLQKDLEADEPYIKQFELFLKRVDPKGHAAVIAEATKVISLMRKNAKLLASRSGKMVMNPRLVDVLLLRAEAHTSSENFAGAVADYTACIDIFAVLSKHYDYNMMEPETETKILYYRGEALARLGDLQGSIADFQAGAAIGRTQGGDFTGLPCVKALMVALARSKAGTPRPHFTLKEIHEWNKELGIKEYSKDVYLCLNCGALPSESVRLKQCGRCRRKWFCGSECQKACWSVHKFLCREDLKKNTVTMIPTGSGHRAKVLADIASDGYAVVNGPSGPAVIFREEGTGQLFESLSNQNVEFTDAAPPADLLDCEFEA